MCVRAAQCRAVPRRARQTDAAVPCRRDAVTAVSLIRGKHVIGEISATGIDGRIGTISWRGSVTLVAPPEMNNSTGHRLHQEFQGH